SKVYARSSRWDAVGTAVGAAGDLPRPSTFAVAQLRALTPSQLATSLRLASADPASFPADLKPEEFEKRIEGLESSARGLASSFEQPRENFQIGVGEALLFSNSDRIMKELLPDNNGLIARLKQINDARELIDTAV